MGTTQISTPPGLPVQARHQPRVPGFARAPVPRAFEPDLVAQVAAPRKYGIVIEEYDCRDGQVVGATSIATPRATPTEFHGVFHGCGSRRTTWSRRSSSIARRGRVARLQQFRFEDLGGGRTSLAARSVFQSVEARDAMVESGMEIGLNEGYGRLDDLVARLLQPVH